MLRRLSSVTRLTSAPSLVRAKPRLVAQSVVPLRRNISLWQWKRIQVSSHQLPVHFFSTKKRKGLVWRVLSTIAGHFIVYFVCWQIFCYFVLDPLEDFAKETWDDLSEEEKKEIVEDVDKSHVFIPFPGIAKPLTMSFFNTASPEMAKFFEIMNDEKRERKIRHTFAYLLRNYAINTPESFQVLGAKDVREIKIVKAKIEILWPTHPPPDYGLEGLLIDDKGIYHAGRVLDTVTAQRLNSALCPTAVASTAWAFCSSLFKETAKDVAKTFSFNAAPTQSAAPRSELRESKKQGAAGDSSKSASTPWFKCPYTSSATNVSLPVFRNSEGTLPSRIATAMNAALATFQKTWRPDAKKLLPQGCIVVRGIIRFTGRRGAVNILGACWYDTESDTFIHMNARVDSSTLFGDRLPKGR